MNKSGWVLFGSVRLGGRRGDALLDVVEDLTDDVWVGDIGDDAQLPAAERA